MSNLVYIYKNWSWRTKLRTNIPRNFPLPASRGWQSLLSFDVFNKGWMQPLFNVFFMQQPHTAELSRNSEILSQLKSNRMAHVEQRAVVAAESQQPETEAAAAAPGSRCWIPQQEYQNTTFRTRDVKVERLDICLRSDIWRFTDVRPRVMEKRILILYCPDLPFSTYCT